ncbi:SDR family NAD(P)-dependent oxidoreductase [Nocardiopsis rhodophaea]|uniref:type I polyketide synthase n=1 Tax=Nocardiopsis rhodophaea TaxID=280238 RepID=UPI0031E0A487
MATPHDDDAIAIVGLSCRFAPDLTTPDQLWSFLLDGRSTVSEMPDKRWDPYTSSGPEATAILRRTTRKGSYLDDIEGFDAEFFQITPREAEYLDPQQRIMLELAWEALGDAGVPPLSLAGSEAGVFVSANSNDYGRRLLEDISRSGAWAVNGTTYYGIANRISYFLDLRGPSMAVDTACAGSLTALHLACQSVRLGESPVAIVGGINIMASPALMVALDAAGATAPDGRSKAFDKAADGYGRGEGGGVLVLKRLSEARRDNDRVRAVIRGSGVFQDGRSDGMMAPRADAQEHMLRQVYARAEVDPATVGYVEAHGTGTPVGDLAEATAIGKVLGGAHRSTHPLLIGSLKANIGHVEAGSGVAGAIKVVLALEHGTIPPSPHEEVNPELEASGVRLVAEPTAWPAGETIRRAGVSSYGVGGTIAHLILEEPPADLAPHRDQPTTGPVVLPLSAVSDSGLRGLAAGTAAWLREHPDTAIDDIAHTLTERRSHLGVRCAVVASSTAEATELLDVVAAGERSPRIAIGGHVPAREAEPVWVFSGHGAQWTGMGRELLRDDAAFAAAIDALADVFHEEMGWTPREVIESGGPWTVSTVQAMTFAMQVALAETWRARGVVPGAVIGHSVGEIAASVVAGALDMAEAGRFACRRASALERVAGRGAMAMVGLPFADVEERLAGREDVVAAIAASPRSTVISGDVDAVDAVVGVLEGEGVEARRVKTDVAFHSPHVTEVLPAVTEAAERLVARTPHTMLYSTALEDPRADEARRGGYWATNLRSPVRFAQAVRAALDDGRRVFLEVSSHPVVAHSITEAAHEMGADDAAVAVSLRRDQPELPTLLANLAQLFVAGTPVEWRHDGALVALPAAEWQHRPYWIFPESAAEGGGRGHDPDSHTLLGGHSVVAGTPAQHVWQTHLDMSSRPYAQSHKVVGVETVPASVVINSFVAAAARGGRRPGLADIVFRTPLAATPPRVVQIALDQNQVRLASRIRRDGAGDSTSHDDEWLVHTTAAVDRDAVVGTRLMEDVEAIRRRCPDEWTWDRVDGMFRNMGVDGYTFPWVVEELRRNATEQLAVVTIDHTPKLHPSSWTAVIDGALTVSGVLVTKENSTTLRTSSHLGSIVFRGDPPGRIVVHTTRSASSPETAVDVLVADEHGTVVCEATGLRYTEVQDRQGGALGPRDLVHELVWEGSEFDGPRTELRQVLLHGDEAVTGVLAERLAARGVAHTCLDDLKELEDLPLDMPGVLVVVPPQEVGGETPEEGAERCAWTLIQAAQRLGRAVGDAPVRLWSVTRGVRGPEREAALAHASLWGVSRIIAGERSDIWGGVADLADGDIDADTLIDLFATAGPTEDILSVTPDGVFAARLARVERRARDEAIECGPNGTYLITGGLGGLGLEVANFLVERGARRLVLVGRRGLPPRGEWESVEDPGVREKIDAVQALEALGATVRVLALDISDEDAVKAALDPSELQLPPIRGIVHAAGVVSDALVDKTDRDGLRTTLSPKAHGAMVLHRMFPPGSVDFFTMFSSCGQLARLTGQASYAAANSFLDGLAALRHADGDRGAVSLAWPQWRGVGMGETTAGTTILEAESRGLGGISATEAFRAWIFAERFDLPYYAVLRVLAERSLPVFSGLTSAADAVDESADRSVDWMRVPEEDLGKLVLADVHEQVAAELSLSLDDVDVDRPLVELGVDSVLTVGLRVRLHRRYAIDLPPTILWSNPTVRAVADFLSEGLLERRVVL